MGEVEAGEEVKVGGGGRGSLDMLWRLSIIFKVTYPEAKQGERQDLIIYLCGDRKQRCAIEATYKEEEPGDTAPGRFSRLIAAVSVRQTQDQHRGRGAGGHVIRWALASATSEL